MSFHDCLIAATETARARLYEAPVIADVMARDFRLGTYTAFLEQAYHHVRFTVPLMMACGARLPDRLDWLRMSLTDYIAEERGHEQWILDDLVACGVDREAVRRSEPGFATEMMVAFVRDWIEHRNPVGFFGMVLVLEGTSTALASSVASIGQQELGLPDEAFHYLVSHGDLDQDHVQFFRGLMDRLTDAGDQEAVIHVARRVYRLYGDLFRSLPRTRWRGQPQERGNAA